MSKEEAFVPASAGIPLDRQRLFVRYFTAILIDLVVLNLFAEYTDKVTINTFTTSLLAAVVLQILLQLTLAIEHRIGDYFKPKPGAMMKTLMIFCMWVVLFGSKFVILEVLAFTFGEKLQFHGMWHGVVTLIVVIIVMLGAEEVVVRIYRRLGPR